MLLPSQRKPGRESCEAWLVERHRHAKTSHAFGSLLVESAVLAGFSRQSPLETSLVLPALA